MVLFHLNYNLTHVNWTYHWISDKFAIGSVIMCRLTDVLINKKKLVNASLNLLKKIFFFSRNKITFFHLLIYSIECGFWPHRIWFIFQLISFTFVLTNAIFIKQQKNETRMKSNNLMLYSGAPYATINSKYSTVINIVMPCSQLWSVLFRHRIGTNTRPCFINIKKSDLARENWN